MKIMRSRPYAVLFLAALAGVSGSALAGPDWQEIGDAGSRLGSAQPIVGVGDLRTINGSLGGEGGDFEDMYTFKVVDPLIFRFDLSGVEFDAAVWLFNVTLANEALGLLANDDGPSSPGPVLTRLSTDGSFAKLSTPGIYAIAISGSGRVPVSRSGQIFFLASRTEISGPDGPGGINPHEGWVGEGPTGDYTIGVEGITFVDVPAPGAAALIGLGGLSMLRRRR